LYGRTILNNHDFKKEEVKNRVIGFAYNYSFRVTLHVDDYE